MAVILSLQLTWGLPKGLKTCSQVVQNSETFTDVMVQIKNLVPNREMFSTTDCIFSFLTHVLFICYSQIYNFKWKLHVHQ